jgi:arylformamidase
VEMIFVCFPRLTIVHTQGRQGQYGRESPDARGGACTIFWTASTKAVTVIDDMKIIDLTQFIEPGMPVYPGTEPPLIKNATTIAAEGFAEKYIAMFSHTGTHMDAPGHILAGAPTLDRLAIDRFTGPGVVIDLPTSEPGRIVTDRDLEPKLKDIGKADFVLFRFDWSRLWGRREYFTAFPVLSEDAAAVLAGADLKGVGVDCISVDAMDTQAFPIHRIFFRAGLVIIENLTGLSALAGKAFTFSAFPLKLRDADGSPVRAAAAIAD